MNSGIVTQLNLKKTPNLLNYTVNLWSFVSINSSQQDLIGKWEKYTQDHYTFDKRLEEFNSWLSNAEVKLDSCQIPATDQETMEEQRTVIQVVLTRIIL